MASEWRVGDERKSVLEKGEIILRAHLGAEAPLRLTMTYMHDRGRWEILTQFTPEGNAPIFLGCEDLSTFPSPTLIAQAMLLS
jgi:hypothetical protein